MTNHVFELRVPGHHIDDHDMDWALHATEVLSSHAVRHFYDANVALNLFEEAGRQRPKGPPWEIGNPQSFAAYAEQRMRPQREMEWTIRRERGIPDDAVILDRELHIAISEEARRRAKREQWARGELPSLFRHRPLFLYAEAFVHSLEMVGKFLYVLEKDKRCPPPAAQACADFDVAFPGLTDLRDTIQHQEDRALGRDKRGKPLNLKPIVNAQIHAPHGGVLVIGNLAGTVYSTTASSGDLVEVDISKDTMLKAAQILEHVMGQFSWKPPATEWPF